MNVDINTPEIRLLLREVEGRASIAPRLVSDFVLMAEELASHGERLSQSTLERVWQYSTRRKPTVSSHTLDVLARYVGHAGWESFRRWVRETAHPESGFFTGGVLDVATLQPGSLLVLTWLPDRQVTISYCGDRRFEVRESLNSSLRPGDSFECTQIQVGQPLYLDRFRRAGEEDDGSNARYAAGRDHGILSVELPDIEKT